MRRPLNLVLMMVASSSCWIGKDVCYSAWLDCESGQICSDGLCRDPGSASFSCTADGTPFAAPVTADSAKFGAAVALSGQNLVVGDPEAKDVAMTPGRVHVFDLSSPVTVRHLNSTAGSGAAFGSTVVARGNGIWVGAPETNSGTVFRFELPALDSGMALTTQVKPGSKAGSTLAADSVILVGASEDNRIEVFPTTGQMRLWFLNGLSMSAFGATVATFGQTGAAANKQGGVFVFEIQQTAPTPVRLDPPAGRTFPGSFANPIALSAEHLLLYTESSTGGDGAISAYSGALAAWALSEPRVIPAIPKVSSLAMEGQLAAAGSVDGKGRAWAALYTESGWRVAEVPAPTDMEWTMAADPRYGAAVAVSGDRVAVGAPGVAGGRVYLYRCQLR